MPSPVGLRAAVNGGGEVADKKESKSRKGRLQHQVQPLSARSTEAPSSSSDPIVNQDLGAQRDEGGRDSPVGKKKKKKKKNKHLEDDIEEEQIAAKPLKIKMEPL